MKRIYFYLPLFCLAGSMMYSCNSNNYSADAYGNFEADNIVVSSMAQGEIIVCNIDEGSQVAKGELLMLIDTISLYLQKEKVIAQISVIRAKKQHIEAQVQTLLEQKQVLEKEVDRIARLLKENAATPKQLDDVEGQLQVLRSQIDAVKSNQAAVDAEKKVIDKQIAIFDDSLDKCKIKSPISGTILECYTDVHELALPGRALFKITDLGNMHLKVFLSENQLGAVKIGQEVSVFIDNMAKEIDTLQGEIIWISDKAEFTPKIIQTRENRVNLVYACKVLVKNDGRIKIGMPGELKF